MAVPPMPMANSQSGPRPSISRINQLDAELIDQEIEAVLFPSLSNALTPFLGTRFNLELSSLLRLIILFSSLKRSCSYGSQLQNLRWSDSRPIPPSDNLGWRPTPRALSQTQIIAYIALDILPSYLNARLRDYMLSSAWADCPPTPNLRSLFTSTVDRSRRRRYWSRLAWDISTKVNHIGSTFQLANLLIFLYDGRHRSILERFLGIRLVHASSAIVRNVSFEFLNRQLVWDSITEFLLFILPFINGRRLKLRLQQARSSTLQAFKSLTRLGPSPSPSQALPDSPNPKKAAKGPYSYLAKTACPICTSKKSSPASSLSITNPNDPFGVFPALPSSAELSAKVAYKVDCCDGLYCYYCLVSEIVSWRESSLDRRWECWRCGKVVLSVRRWDGC